MNRESLEEHRTQLAEQIETDLLAREIRALESYLSGATMAEATRDYISPQELRRETGWGPADFFVSRADDYREGRCEPWYRTDQDVQEMRGMGRYLAGSDELASAVLSNLRNYTVGEGATVTVSAKNESDQALAEQVQEFVDEFLDENELTDEGESDALVQSVIDGDVLLWLQPGERVPRVRHVTSEQIATPSDPRSVEDFIGEVGLSWSFGVASAPNDPTDVRGYFIDWFGLGGENWDFAPAEESVFIKRNVPRVCKRGISDYYIPFKAITKAAKLIDRTIQGATIQASIAYIVQAAKGTTQANLQTAVESSPLLSKARALRQDGAHVSVDAETFLGGKVIRTAGHEYHAGPLGVLRSPVFLEVYQGVARRVGSRWCMPEYMISGDASNSNYSSTLTAETPFVQRIKEEQSGLARVMRRLVWKALAMVRADADDLKRRLEVTVEYQSPETRNALEEEQVRDLQQKAGILSPATRAAMAGLDYEQEVSQGAEKEQFAPLSGFDQQQDDRRESHARRLTFSLLEGADGG